MIVKNPFKKVNTDLRLHLKEHGYAALIFMAIFCYLELMLHLVIFKGIGLRIFYPILFSLVSGGFIHLACSLLPEKVNRWIGFVAIFALTIYFETQLVYYCIFGSFLPISQMTMGADAVTNFFAQVIHAILTNFWKVLLLFLPVPAAGLLIWKKKFPAKRLTLLQIPLYVILILVIAFGTLFTMRHFKANENSAFSILTNPNTSTTSCVKNLGVAITAVQETRGFLNAKDEEGFEMIFEDTSLEQWEATKPNAQDFDFSKMKSRNPKISAINKYLAGISPTSKNKYTGIAKDFNVITICAESYSPVFIDKELTPTLYKLSTNGLVFKNFYTSFPNTTTNGEYAMCMGLMPNMSRTKVESSFDDSNGNYLPYCLGNVYKEQGYPAKAYHNYFGTFYDRVISHANMGYDFKAIDAGLKMEVQWPSSDLEMFEISMPEYINSEAPFHAYYMTFSGHYQYDWKNAMSLKNKKAVEHLSYSDPVKAYIACNLELEYALSALMEELEKAGQADKTMIVLTGDHYPYGLSEEQYNEISGKEVDTTFERFRNSFICYIPGMEPVEVDSYCSTIDILPTVLNLLGVEYDSRLLAGKDVMSDAPHLAILTDRSFIADDFRFDVSTGKTFNHKGEEIERADLKDYCNYVANLFTFSNGVLETDYYSYVFDRSSEHHSEETLHYADITDPFAEAAVIYVVNDGLMKPESETNFGAKKDALCSEIITSLHIKSGADKKEPDAYKWALSEGLIDESFSMDSPMTYAHASSVLYRYMVKIEGMKPIEINQEIKDAEKEFPHLDREAIVAMHWCNSKKIIAGPSEEESIYKFMDVVIMRYQLAVYLQRMKYS